MITTQRIRRACGGAVEAAASGAALVLLLGLYPAAAQSVEAVDVNPPPDFYRYLARVASEAPSVPFIGSIPGEVDQPGAFVGWTSGAPSDAISDASTEASGASAPLGDGEQLSPRALAQIATRWDRPKNVR